MGHDIDLIADLNTQDDDGLGWAMLRIEVVVKEWCFRQVE